MIDRVAEGLGRTLVEVPVGFKWFVPGLLDGSIGFGGEESAGASFLRHDGTVWTTDKDGDPARTARVRDPGGDRVEPERAIPGAHRRARRSDLRAHRRAGDSRGEGCARFDVAGSGPARRARRRADHGGVDRGARQRRVDRWAEGDDRVGVVRSSAVGHRGRLQDLRGELPRSRAPSASCRTRPAPWSPRCFRPTAEPRPDARPRCGARPMSA